MRSLWAWHELSEITNWRSARPGDARPKQKELPEGWATDIEHSPSPEPILHPSVASCIAPTGERLPEYLARRCRELGR